MHLFLVTVRRKIHKKENLDITILAKSSKELRLLLLIPIFLHLISIEQKGILKSLDKYRYSSIDNVKS